MKLGVFTEYYSIEYTTKLIIIITHECVPPSTKMIGTWIPRGGRGGEECDVKTDQITSLCLEQDLVMYTPHW